MLQTILLIATCASFFGRISKKRGRHLGFITLSCCSNRSCIYSNCVISSSSCMIFTLCPPLLCQFILFAQLTFQLLFGFFTLLLLTVYLYKLIEWLAIIGRRPFVIDIWGSTWLLLVIPQRYPSSSHPGTPAVPVGYRVTAGVPNSPLSEVKYQCIRTWIHHIK